MFYAHQIAGAIKATRQKIPAKTINQKNLARILSQPGNRAPVAETFL